MLDDLKIAIVCDWLTVYAGAEKVVYEMHKLFPKATIFTSLYDKNACDVFENANVLESGLSYIPFARKFHRFLFPFMPKVFERMDFSSYDLVISSSHSAAKGIITKPQTLHVSYCHSPMRYVWDRSHGYQNQFMTLSAFRTIYRPILHNVRLWDRAAADRVDLFVANAEYIKKRIGKYYRRDSHVISPPVNLTYFTPGNLIRDSYLAVGRLIPYKRFDLAVALANEMNLPLKIVGDGPALKSLKKMAGPSVTFLGRINDDELLDVYRSSKALIYPQVEDFGIVPLEAMACGTPVIAYGLGGATETVQEGVSGVFFEKQSVESMIEAVNKFSNIDWDPVEVSESIENFSISRFRSELLTFLEKSWKNHQEMLAFNS